MRRPLIILMVATILMATLISQIEITKSWYSDTEEADIEVSIMMIEITDSNNNEVSPETADGPWSWTLSAGTYTIVPTVNVSFSSTAEISPATDGTLGTDGRSLSIVSGQPCTITLAAGTTLTLTSPHTGTSS
ncbi:hypothetical protein [Candidatus Methanoprimaticola sp. MG2]|uniref:hypothetical protein n=1 Tax=Candidatus Methanoprimaticola sp. MG2 TaxID=3228838 RepID=UPI0039C6911F